MAMMRHDGKRGLSTGPAPGDQIRHHQLRCGTTSGARTAPSAFIMLGEDAEDVFDSVTWESPADNGYTAVNASASTRPGFRQSIEEGEEDRGPHDPKWYGYLVTQVKDPIKELAETKDAYVSYLVTAKVRIPRAPPHTSVLM